MEWTEWFKLLGGASFLVAIVTGIIKYVQSYFKKINAETAALKLGVQAMLRDRLYQEFRIADNAGGASIEARENFLNMYEQYHALGKNGAMDDTKKKYFELPIK